MACRRSLQSLAVLMLLGLAGCKGDSPTEPPIQSTQLTTKAKPPAGQPGFPTKVETPQPLPPIVKKEAAPGLGLSREEEQFLTLAHTARDQAKLPRLRPSPVLLRLARDHAAKMAREKALDFVNQLPGYASQASASNVGSTSQLDVQQVMANDGVQEHTKDPRFQEFGVGVAFEPAEKKYYYALIYAQPTTR